MLRGVLVWRRIMCRRFVLVLAVATLSSACGAQSASSSPQAKGPPPAVPASQRFVVLDVAVQDHQGQPVRGLKAQNFRVTEGGVPQTIARVDEHSSLSSPPKVPRFPPLPPGNFTDYTPIASGETLNILLIDALNTPFKGEGFVRSQLLQYVRQANPNTRIAIFGLANHLMLLQGFTSDPSVLRDVVERKLIARAPALPDHPTTDQPASTRSALVASPAAAGSPSAILLAANLRAFEDQLGALETDFRVPYTLDAFNTLAHYLGSFPGRKNLIWFSGSFPLNIVPDPSLPHPFRVDDADPDELRETVDLLSKAQVAIYPVDARSLIAQSAASGSADKRAHNFSLDRGKVSQSQAAERAMMEAIAANTGGRAIYNPESLAQAVNTAVSAGSNYYTLAYRPTNPVDDGSYRPIHIDITGVDAEQPLQLSYRRGDYSNSAASEPQDRAAAYEHAVMRRGGPTPEDLLFRVRVLPACTTTETALAPDNQLAPFLPEKGPFRRYDLDFLSQPGELTFTQQPDGHRVAKVEILVYVFDTEGTLLDTTGQEAALEPLHNDESKLARSVVRYHLQVSVPDRAETFLRIGMRDVPTNRFGVVEIPTSAVTSLPPATYEPAAAPTSPPAPAPAKPAGRPTPPQV